MKIDCPYLTSFKEYNKEYNNEDLTVRIYKCLLSNALLKTRDLQGKWACGGCTIPGVLKDKHCKHLTPHKAFFIRGISHTFFTCELLNLVMDITIDFCRFNCKLYDHK